MQRVAVIFFSVCDFHSSPLKKKWPIERHCSPSHLCVVTTRGSRPWLPTGFNKADLARSSLPIPLPDRQLGGVSVSPLSLHWWCPSGAQRGLAASGQQQNDQADEPGGGEPLQQRHAVFGDDHLGQVVGDEGNLVSHAHEDEGADQDVERWVSRNQHQDSLGVRRQPDVILADEQLGETKTRLQCSAFCCPTGLLSGSCRTSHKNRRFWRLSAHFISRF